MLMVVEKQISGRICHEIHRFAKGNNRYVKNYDKNIESSYFMFIWMCNVACKWLYMGKYGSKFDEYFIKNYDEDSNKGYTFEVDVEYPKDLHDFYSNCHS